MRARVGCVRARGLLITGAVGESRALELVRTADILSQFHFDIATFINGVSRTLGWFVRATVW